MSFAPFTQSPLPAATAHDVLRNDRRRAVIEYLRGTTTTTLRDLSEAIAVAESGESPAPTKLRESVYNSLHQTHLPKLDDLGLVEYDKNRKTVALCQRARGLDVYMEVVTRFGITWANYYRGLATLALLSVLLTAIDTPSDGNTTLLVTSIFLAIVAVSTAYQLWTHRWVYLYAITH